MEDISKPRIVDFLRTCDKHNWVFPRIRFASVRSKPELIEDIDYNFKVTREGSFISIVPRRLARRIPAIQYDLDEKISVIPLKDVSRAVEGHEKGGAND